MWKLGALDGAASARHGCPHCPSPTAPTPAFLSCGAGPHTSSPFVHLTDSTTFPSRLQSLAEEMVRVQQQLANLRSHCWYTINVGLK